MTPRLLILCATALMASPGLAADCLHPESGGNHLLVAADDVGMHRDIDGAAFDLLRRGHIDAVALMAPAPSFESAIRGLPRGALVGIHLTLTNEWQERLPWGGVLTPKQAPSLYNAQGRLWASVAELASHGRPQEVAQELAAQIEKLRRAGLRIAYADAHMSFWQGSDALRATFEKTIRDAGIPIRVAPRGGLPAEDEAMPDSYTVRYDPQERQGAGHYRDFHDTLRHLTSGIHHLSIHPALNTDDARRDLPDLSLRISDYTLWAGDLPALRRHLNLTPADYARCLL